MNGHARGAKQNARWRPRADQSHWALFARKRGGHSSGVMARLSIGLGRARVIGDVEQRASRLSSGGVVVPNTAENSYWARLPKRPRLACFDWPCAVKTTRR